MGLGRGKVRTGTKLVSKKKVNGIIGHKGPLATGLSHPESRRHETVES